MASIEKTGIDMQFKIFTNRKKITASISAFIFSSSFFSISFIAAPSANAWSSAQTTVSVFDGTSNELGHSIKVDSSGNIYTTGYFLGTVDFDPGEGITNLTSVGNLDVFVSKLNSSGDFLWAKSFGGFSEDIGHSIAVDGSGNVYTTGYFYESVDFDPGEGTANLTSAGEQDVFVSKLNSSGDFLWAKSFGGILYDAAYSIATDNSGNVYTTGFFQGTVDFDPSDGTTNRTSVGSTDVFVSKLNSSGDLLWAMGFGGTSDDWGYSIAVDSSGNVYITGFFYDVFVSKLNSSGDFLWVKSFSGSASKYSHSIAVDSSGNVYTTGYFLGTADFDPGEGIANLTSAGFADAYVSKLDSSGNHVWVKSFGGSSGTYGHSIAVDSSGNVYTTGSFYESSDFDPGAGTANLTSVAEEDAFVSKLNSSGDLLWAKGFGGTSNDSGYSIAVDSSGNVYTTGFFYDTVDFDPGEGTMNLTSAGGSDVFVLKLNSLGIATILVESDKSVENARKAAEAEAAKKQRELMELLSIIPSIGGLALNIGDLTNSLLTTKCVKGKTVKNVKKGAKCPKGYVKKK
jgi:hypothetical protein